MSYKIVFIGGPSDGRRMMLNKLLPLFKTIELEPFSYSAFTEPREVFPTYNYYKLEKFCDVYFYMYTKLKRNEVVNKLLEGYYPPENKQ